MRFRAAALAAALCLAAPLAALADQSDAFRPTNGGTVNLAVTSSSGNVAVQTNGQVRIYDSGSVAAFCKFGTGAGLTATTTADIPIAPGSVEVMTATGDHIACITATGTATVYFTPGVGL